MLEAYSEQSFDDAPAVRLPHFPEEETRRSKSTEAEMPQYGALLQRELNGHFDEVETVIDAIPTGVWLAKDPSCSRVYVNRNLAELLSISTSMNVSLKQPESISLPFRFTRNGMSVPVDELPLYAAAKYAREFDSEVDIEFNDGRRITSRQSARPVFDKNGELCGSICITTDVTRQRRDTRAIKFLVRASEILSSSLDIEKTLHKLARQVVPSIADIYSVDLLSDSGSIERISHAVAENGNPAVQAWGRLAMPLSDYPEHPAHDVLRTGVPFFADQSDGALSEKLTYRHDMLQRLHSMCLTSIIIVPIESRGRTLGAMSFATSGDTLTFDRKDLKMVAELARRTATSIDNARLLAATERSREESQRANRAKGDFLAAMSHELRTPLNAIAGYCQLMLMGLRGEVTSEQREDLERISLNQHHLLGLINSILNYTKLDAGIVQYDIATVDVAKLLEGIESMVAPQIFAKDLRFKKEFVGGDVWIRADEDKVRQIMINLLSNAIKFTPTHGTVAVGYSVHEGNVRIYVHDTGIGIAPNKVDRIFEPFVQVDRTLRTFHEGVGLGLAISRDLARGMGGDVVVRSEVDRGSTFTVVFPRLSGPSA